VAFDYTLKIPKTSLMLKYQAVKILTIKKVFAQSDVGSYTQGRIAGDFLSSRKAARAERYPPKTTAAALDG
jgi:hypothetical protein